MSCTTLESFRRWSEPEQTWMSEQELMATVRGEWTPTHRVDLGQAFGKILERPDRWRTTEGAYHYTAVTERADGTMVDILFDRDVIERSLDAIGPRGVFEAKTVTTYGGVDVVMKADHLYGARIDEFKSTLSSFDIDKYINSCQWRYLLDGFGARKLRYHIFLLAEDARHNNRIRLRDVESFDLYPYAGLTADCEDLVRRFSDWARVRGVDTLLEARQEAAR